MKKKMKKIIAIILSILIFSSLTIPAYAQSDIETDNLCVTDGMIEIIDLLFNKQAKIYLEDNRDITDSFVNSYQLLYDVRDYQGIKNAFFRENVYKIEGAVIVTASKSETTMNYSRSITTLVMHTGTYYDGKKWYITSQASGTYTVGYTYPNITVITNVATPTISVSFDGEGAGFVGIVDSFSVPTPVINSTATSFSFYTTIRHHLTCPIPGLTYLTGTLGPYTNTFTYTISV